ncbi:MAG: hypothetical protein K6A68_00730, partial [Clostridiales bacterium]|nr:hypothetical protein [Clostridiales bacterium]
MLKQAGIAEHVLLIQPGIGTQCRKRIDAAVMPVNDTLNPDIDRRGTEAVIGEKQHTAGHLD